jgi:hypothetical protein
MYQGRKSILQINLFKSVEQIRGYTNEHSFMPAIPYQRVAPWQIARTSGGEDSSMGTAVLAGYILTAAIGPASVVSHRPWC